MLHGFSVFCILGIRTQGCWRRWMEGTEESPCQLFRQLKDIRYNRLKGRHSTVGPSGPTIIQPKAICSAEWFCSFPVFGSVSYCQMVLLYLPRLVMASNSCSENACFVQVRYLRLSSPLVWPSLQCFYLRVLWFSKDIPKLRLLYYYTRQN